MGKPFLVIESIKPISYFLIHFHIVRRKKVQLVIVRMGVPVKVDFRPVLWVRTLKKARIVSMVSKKSDRSWA